MMQDVESSQTSLPFIGDGKTTQDVEEGSGENRRGGICLEWRDIQCFVAEPEEQGRFSEYLGLEKPEGKPTKQITHGASGFARAGEVLAVMGPSGSGKTTLLNVLAQRPTLGKSGYWTGEILLNGDKPWPDWERDMAYVMQKDIFYDELNVQENLLTTAMLRLPPSWSRDSKLEYLGKTIDGLGLTKVRDTRIGTAVDRGLSGGELKRTGIANELLALPRIFLLDEPLTGLDSSRAVEVMKALSKLARCDGTTVLLTIHQPSSAIYATFDRLLLLGAGGRTAFCGDVSQAVPHFSKLGYALPELWAPSDHFIEILTDEAKRTEVCDAWEAEPLYEPVPERQPAPPSLAPMPLFTQQVQVLLPRSFKRIRRSYLKALNWKLHIALSVTWGMIYFGVGLNVHSRITDFVGAIFFIVAHWSWTPLFQGLGNFPKEKEMLTKERASKVYEIRSFFAAQVLAEAPILLVFPLIFFAIIWPMAALPYQVAIRTFLFVALNIQVCSAMSMLISAYCMDGDTAVSLAIIVMVFQMCAGGYFADMRMLPFWIGWVRYTSVYYFSFGAILRLLVAEPFGEELHREAIAKYSFSEAGYFWEVVIMCGMSIVMRFLTYLQLRFTKKLKFS
jgi:ABC-type multidrug transport system ATPase subunit